MYSSLQPMLFTDPLGLCSELGTEPPLETEKKKLTDKEACDAATGNKQWGVVVYYEGRKIICSFYPAKKPTNMTNPSGADIANKIIAECTQRHEDDHHDDTEECDPNRSEPYTPKWRDGLIGNEPGQHVEECKAHRVGLACAENALCRCDDILK
jgi:hypothetical protein